MRRRRTREEMQSDFNAWVFKGRRESERLQRANDPIEEDYQPLPDDGVTPDGG